MGGGGGGGGDEPSGITIKGKKGQAGVTFSGYASSLDTTNDKQLEAKATTASKTFGAMTAAQRRAKSISELERRLEKSQLTLPSFGGAVATVVSRQNLRNQISALKEGGFGEYVRSETGAYVTVGVNTKEGGGDAGLFGRRGDISGTQVRSPRKEGDPPNQDIVPDTPKAPEVTPEVTPEVVPDEPLLNARRRTRGKRFGGAGDFGEGILVRNTQK